MYLKYSVVLEAMADGGVMMGLPRDIAFELAAQGEHNRHSAPPFFFFF